MKMVKLPKDKTFIRRKYWGGSATFPLELQTLPKGVYENLLDYLYKAIEQRVKKKGHSVRSITIHNVSFQYTTIELDKKGEVKP